MNRTYLIVPLLGMAAFAAYFVYWQAQPKPPRSVETKMADDYAGRDGKKEAEAELAAGRLVLIESGPAVSWDRERREIAQSKYGVELRRNSAVQTEAFARYVDGFNRVMRPRILMQHGRGFFDTLHREAIALMETRRSSSESAKAP